MDDIPVDKKISLNDLKEQLLRSWMDIGVRLNLGMTALKKHTKFREYDRTVLPVTNSDNLLLGVVTIDDVMDVQELRDTKTMQKFGGKATGISLCATTFLHW